MNHLPRRMVLLWLLGWSSLAFADKDDKKDKDRDKQKQDRDKDKPKEKKKEPKENKDAHGPNRGLRRLYTEVTLVHKGHIQVQGGRLEINSPWTQFLFPGMWVQAWGEWEEGVFKASRLEVVQPGVFSYFRGPAELLGRGNGWVEAWYGPDLHLLVSHPASPGAILLLAKGENGRLLAIPPTLSAPAYPGEGWFLFSGEKKENRLYWKQAQPLDSP